MFTRTSQDVTVIVPSEKTEEALKHFVRDRLQSFPRSEITKELQQLDKYYHLQTRRDPDDEDFNSRYRDVDMGIVNPNAETDCSFYTDTFLTSSPIFSAVSKKDKMDAAKAMEGKFGKDEREFNYKSQLIKAFRNISKHNKCLLEVDWSGTVDTKSYQDTLDANGNPDIKTFAYEGNKLKSWSLYNSFWDTSVDICDLADEGEFAANVDLISYVKLAELEESLGVEFDLDIWTSAQQTGWNEQEWQSPNIWAEKSETKKDDVNWLQFAGYSAEETSKEAKQKFRDAKKLYTIHKMYARVIPALSGISVPKANRPQIFKMIFVNGQLAYLKHLQNFHNRLPVVGGQAVEDDTGLQTQGPAQMSAGYQETTKMLLDRQFAILDRLIGDRALYDPKLINPESVSSKVPDAKIPVRPSATAGIGGAYQSIPYSPNGFFEFGQLITAMKQYSEDAVGINKAQQGSFVKGNKTLGEWEDVMQGANSKPFMRAVVVEATLLNKVKFLIKSNILQYQTKEEFIIDGGNDTVEYNPAEVRQNILDVTLADGLNSAAKILKSGGLEYMLQLILQVPQFAMKFDAAGVFAHLMMQGKGIDIRSYALTPEQQAQAAVANNPSAQQQSGPVTGQ